MGVTATFFVADNLFNSGRVTGDVKKAVGMGKKETPSIVAGPPITDDRDNQNEAQKAAEKRRRMYAGIGRSSTILTGPSGLGSLGESNQAPKQLLGI